MALRPCIQQLDNGQLCGALSSKTRCPTHTRQADRARGTRTQRGYGVQHQQLRQRIAPQVATGTINCVRCGELIRPDHAWDLDHDNHGGYLGPSHAQCNRSAGGKARGFFR